MESSHVFQRSLHVDSLEAVRAEGNYIYTKDGQKLLDASCGAAVSSIGHGNSRILACVQDQLATLDYVFFNTFTNPPAEELAKELTKTSGLSRAIFYSSGSEAMESAIKLVRQYYLESKQPERIHFIARRQTYHGNTLAALGLSYHKQRCAPFTAYFPSCFHHISPCFAYRYKLSEESDEAYVKRLADELEAKFQELGPHTVAAFVAETLVGSSSGCTPAVPGYFQAMRDICDRYGALFILDEIMCGIGRTGKMHAWQWEDLSSPPDIQVNGKGLGGGYAPIAAVLVSKKIVDAFDLGSGSFNNIFSYQSHPVGCRVALEILRIMEDERLIEQCHQRGLFLEMLLKKNLGDHRHVGDIRGRGLFWALEFVKVRETKEPYEADRFVVNFIFKECIQRGVIIYPCAKGTIDGIQGDHLLIAPPFTVTENELVSLVEVLKMSIDSVLHSE